ncbi:MAG: hypothetical protein HY741_20615 [Chloroflexi bacterium]|nr:hypothetical protein [Chloroflexota bacterium]
MIEITIQVPELLAERLEQARTRLPEVLALGLQELSPLPAQVYRYILEFLASDPTRDEILQFGPTTEMRTRANMLLDKERSAGLTTAEAQELDEYVRIDHLVTMLKARTLPYAQSVS